MNERVTGLHRQLAGPLVVATHNKGKLVEIRDLLAPYGVEALSAGELGLPEPEETGDSFMANAELKAFAASSAAHLPALADDSGLCVESLGGAPGIYSARWAGPSADFHAAMARIERELADGGAAPPWRAHFVSALALTWPDGHIERFEDRVDGVLTFPPKGSAGFGYDPIFIPDGHTRSFGEMTAIEKHGIPADGTRALSHRARAFQALEQACLSQRVTARSAGSA
jgi:XTP/dITP diphosphohydrolase